MTTKLFERLVTKFSIKVNDLAKYLEISKATIYNYRNLDDFSDIPNDKQMKIFYWLQGLGLLLPKILFEIVSDEILSQRSMNRSRIFIIPSLCFWRLSSTMVQSYL